MATKYISPTGSDTTGDGTSGNPWQTIAKFLASSSSGDTCIMAAGTYSTVDQQTFVNRTLTGPAYTVGFPTAVIDFSSSAKRLIISGATTTFNNIKFTGFVSSSNKAMFHPEYPSGGTVIFNNCQFDYNYLSGDASGKYGGLFATFHVAGVSCYMSYTCNRCIFSRLYKVAGAGATSIFAMGAATTSLLTLSGCIVALPSSHGLNYLLSKDALSTITIKNTIIANYHTSALAFYGTGSGAVVTYSCLYNLSGAPTGTGVITSNPLLMDTGNFDFRLRPGSPCIDTGTLL